MADIRSDYELAERVGTQDAWQSFLNAHPDGYYSELARAQLVKLLAEERQRRDATEREQQARIEREQADRAQRERLAGEHAERERLMRGQLVQQQAAREQAQREQAQREEAARAEQERARVAREQAELNRADAPSNKTAMLTPSEPASAPVRPSISGGALVQEIKKELKRVGCYAGRIDDKWKTSSTTSSIKRFVQYANLSTTPRDPDADFLAAVRARPQRVCPLECGTGEVEANGRCIAKSCPHGRVLNDGGACEKRRERVKTASRPPHATRSGSRQTSSESPGIVPAGIEAEPVGRRGRWRARTAAGVTVTTHGGIVTPGGQVTCGRRGCQTVPKGCHAIRGAGGGGLGGRIFCP